MQGYETILVPIDIYSDYELVVEKAIAIAGNSHKIHLLYVACLLYTSDAADED